MSVLGHLDGGVPYYAPIGELNYDPIEDRVQCHLCGGWFRLVAGSHLTGAHGWTAREYREAFRLPSTEPTCSRGLSERQRINGRQRVAAGETPVGARLDPAAKRAMFAGRRFPRWRSLGAVHPELVAELHPSRNGKLDPFAIATGSHRRLWWRCLHGHEWMATVYNRAGGTGCPQCARAGAKGPKPRCTLADFAPGLVAQLHPTLNKALDPTRIGPYSHRKVWWHCAEDHEWQAEIQSRTRGSECPYCRGERRRDASAGPAPDAGV